MSADPKKSSKPGLGDEKLLDHNYDGIQELDNPLPAWWVYLFYITIVFSAVYFVYFTFFSKSSHEKADLAVAQIRQVAAPAAVPGAAVTPPVAADAAKPVFGNDAATLASGKKVFDTKCSVCHAPDGGGLIGPNFTDNYWIHGKGALEDIYQTIVNGVPDKGMISWKPLLTEEEIGAVTVYVKSLQGTTPAAPKAPQGDPV